MSDGVEDSLENVLHLVIVDRGFHLQLGLQNKSIITTTSKGSSLACFALRTSGAQWELDSISRGRGDCSLLCLPLLTLGARIGGPWTSLCRRRRR